MTTADQNRPTALTTTIGLVVKPSTLEAMEQWARWRCSGGADHGIVSGTAGLLGKLQNSKRARICPQCKGSRRARYARRCPECGGKGDILEDLQTIARSREVPCLPCASTGEINGRTCAKCRGRGKTTKVERTVHPATISGNIVYATGRSIEHSDRACSLISAIVLRWENADGTFWWHHIVLEEYQPGDARTREQKATGMGISPSFYSRELKKALLFIQKALETLI